jgi:putative RecB family exonuclease
MIAPVDNGVGSKEPTPIESLQKSVSASRLNSWVQCRLKFYFRYVLQITKPKTAALHYGSVVHLVLQHWNMARWRKQAFDLTKLRQVFDLSWKEQGHIDWEGEEEAQQQSAWSVLETYFKDTPIPANELPEAVEVPIEADLTKHGLPVLKGILDLVRAGGKIVDFKSSGKTPVPEMALHQNGIQLDCYSVLYREAAGKQESGRELHHLIKTKVPKVIITPTEPMTDNEEVRLFRVMESYVEGLDRGDFVPSPGMQCAGCEFFNECRKWEGGRHA